MQQRRGDAGSATRAGVGGARRPRAGGRALVWVMLLALAAGVAVAMIVARTRSRFAPAAPNRDLVPDTVAWYAEATGLTGSWNALATSASWADLLASRTFVEVSGRAEVKDAVAICEDVAAKAGLPLSAANAMKVFGRDVAVGLDFAGSDVPHVIVLTKLDVDALLADFLPGETDRSKLAAAVRDRAARCTTSMETTAHRDIEILRASRGSLSFHFSVLGDTLVASDDRGLVVRAIDAHRDGGAGTLGRSAKFRADMAALPAQGVVREWCDLARLRGARPSVEAFAKRAGDDMLARAAGLFLDGTATIPSYARSVDIPGGDLYSIVPHTASASAPAPVAPLDCAARLLPDAQFYAEIRNAGEVAQAWRESEVRRRMADGPIGREISKFLDAPERWADEMRERFVPDLAMDDEDFIDELDDSDESDDGDRPAVGRFEMRMGMRFLEVAVGSVYGGEVSIAVQADAADPSDMRVAAAMRPEFGARMILHAALALGQASGSLQAVDRQGRRCYRMVRDDGEDADTDDDDSADEDEMEADAATDGEMAWIGDTMVACDGERTMERILTDVSAAGAAPSRRAGELKAFGPYHVAMHVSLSGVGDFLTDMPEMEPMRAMLGSLQDLTCVWSVAPKLASIDGRWVLRVRDATGRNEAADPRPTPRTWSLIPSDAFLHAVSYLDFGKQFDTTVAMIGREAWREMEPELADFEREVGVDVETQLLPALGPEFGFLVTHAKRPSAQEPPVPGVALVVETRQQAVVRKFVDGALRVAESAFAESQGTRRSGGGRRPARSPEKLFLRTQHDDGTETISVPSLRQEQGVPLEPALGFVGDHLVIALDVSTLDRMRAVAAGREPSVTSTPAHSRLVASLGAPPRSGRTHLDWGRMLDQLAEYAPEIGRFFPSDSPMEFPDPPEDPSDPAAMEAWTRSIQAAQLAASSDGERRFREGLDAARIIDGMAAAQWFEGNDQHGRFTLRFADPAAK